MGSTPCQNISEKWESNFMSSCMCFFAPLHCFKAKVCFCADSAKSSPGKNDPPVPGKIDGFYSGLVEKTSEGGEGEG